MKSTVFHSILRFKLSLALLLVGEGASETAYAGTHEEQVVRLTVSLELAKPEFVMFENIRLTRRISNPNPFPVRIRGFEFGFREPRIEALIGGRFIWLNRGSSETILRPHPLDLAPGATLEFNWFLYDDLARDRWPLEPGTYTLRASMRVTSGWNAEGDPVTIEWERPEVSVRVVDASPQDREAWAFLSDGLQDRKAEVREGSFDPPAVGQFRNDLYARFLKRYESSPYAPEIRWQYARTLRGDLGSRRVAPAEFVKRLEDFEECLFYCLDRGGAFASDFLEWGESGNAYTLMELFLQSKRPDSLARYVQALDTEHSDDEEGILYRRVLVQALAGSIAEARNTEKTLIEKFPDSTYTKRTTGLLRRLEDHGNSDHPEDKKPRQ